MVEHISEKGLALIQRFEGCYLTAYRDRVGVLTIGYGTTNADKSITGCTIKSGMKISKATAVKWLKKSLTEKYEPKVKKYDGKYEWTQNEFDALVSFAYNIGNIDQLTANGKRTKTQIGEAMLLYNKAGGQKVKGLVERRQAEHDLFCRGLEIGKDFISTITSNEQAAKKGIQKWIPRGEAVEIVQKELTKLGYTLGAIDGICGKKTVAAIMAFQKDAGLVVDGLCGVKTWNALMNHHVKPVEKKPHVVEVKGKTITIDGKSLKVFNQHKLSGKYAKNLSSNGCGASCTVFALTLRGEKITPAELLDKAISLWGKWPRACLLSAPGIASIIKEYGYPAKYYSVTSDNRDSLKGKIDAALKAGKQVVCWTNDNGKKGDPFASGQHYVMAVGYNEAGKVVVANSANKGPVNVVTLSTLVKFLQNGSGEDKHWWKRVSRAAGIVVVG